MIYVPEYNNSECVIVYSSDTIRKYDSVPTRNSTISYTDYFYNSHYISRDGSQTFGNTATLPVCLDNITTNFYHRTDILDILLISTLIIGWTWFLVGKLVKTLLKGGRYS